MPVYPPNENNDAVTIIKKLQNDVKENASAPRSVATSIDSGEFKVSGDAIFSVSDRNGNIIIENDADSGFGLNRPFIPINWYTPIFPEETFPLQPTGGATDTVWVSKQESQFILQNPEIFVNVNVGAFAGTLGECYVAALVAGNFVNMNPVKREYFSTNGDLVTNISPEDPTHVVFGDADPPVGIFAPIMNTEQFSLTLDDILGAEDRSTNYLNVYLWFFLRVRNGTGTVDGVITSSYGVGKGESPSIMNALYG